MATVLELYATDVCGLQCPHCYMFGSPKNSRHLPLERAIVLVDKIPELDFAGVTGGDGLLWDALPEFLYYIKETRPDDYVKIMTSAIPLYADKFKGLRKLLAPYADIIGLVLPAIDGYHWDYEPYLEKMKSNLIEAGWGERKDIVADRYAENWPMVALGRARTSGIELDLSVQKVCDRYTDELFTNDPTIRLKVNPDGDIIYCCWSFEAVVAKFEDIVDLEWDKFIRYIRKQQRDLDFLTANLPQFFEAIEELGLYPGIPENCALCATAIQDKDTVKLAIDYILQKYSTSE